jgi:hypothetical protein
LFSNLATGHFSGKFFSHCTPSGPTGSNDTRLMSVWCPGAESIAGQTHTDGIRELHMNIFFWRRALGLRLKY